jgi:hypothetical protein
MSGFERLEKAVEGQKDVALRQTVDYLLSRKDMEQKYLNEEKTLGEMVDFIHNKAKKHLKNGWTYITNEVVFAWAIMYFALPNELLKIDRNKSVQNQIKTSQENKNNNVISIEKGKKIVEKKKKIEQLSLFGGVV